MWERNLEAKVELQDRRKKSRTLGKWNRSAAAGKNTKCKIKKEKQKDGFSLTLGKCDYQDQRSGITGLLKKKQRPIICYFSWYYWNWNTNKYCNHV